MEHLQNVITLCGGRETFEREYLSKVDEDVIKSFGELGVM